MTSRSARTPPCSGTWTAPSSTPSPTGWRPSTPSPRSTAAPGTRRTRSTWSATTCSTRAATSASTWGSTCEPAEIVEQLLDGVIEQIRVAVPWRPGAVELLADLRAAGVPCALVTMSYRRFVDPILDALPEGPFDHRGDRRRGRAGQAVPRPVPQGRPAPRRRPGRLPGDRGLQHRRPVGRDARAAPCCACPTTCRSWTVSGGCSPTRWSGSAPQTFRSSPDPLRIVAGSGPSRRPPSVDPALRRR